MHKRAFEYYGKIHVAYGFFSNEIVYNSNTSGAWSPTDVPTGGLNSLIDIAVSSDGKPVLFYGNTTDGLTILFDESLGAAVIPEPVSLLLLSIGIVALRKRVK